MYVGLTNLIEFGQLTTQTAINPVEKLIDLIKVRLRTSTKGNFKYIGQLGQVLLRHTLNVRRAQGNTPTLDEKLTGVNFLPTLLNQPKGLLPVLDLREGVTDNCLQCRVARLTTPTQYQQRRQTLQLAL